MNNATLALNVARPPAPTTPPVAASTQDDAQPSKRFDAALDAAHADARAPRKQPEATAKEKDAPPPAKADAAKATAKQDDKPAKKDDEAGDVTSIATTMLSLIGVPPTVTDVAAKALGAVKDATADAAGTGAALGTAASLAGILPGAAATDADAAALKDATAASLGLASGAVPAGTVTGAAAAAPSFAALLATQVDAKTVKDDASVDATNGSPMPFAHAQGIGQGGTPVMQLQATQPATSPQFAQELGEQIAWMGSGQVKEARIKLHPEELGSMDVRVSLDGGKVNVAVIAQHPAAVHAVQQTLSQLDSMLAHHGLSLGQANVGQRQAEQGGDGGNGHASDQSGDGGSAGVETIATSRVSRGLVDEVA